HPVLAAVGRTEEQALAEGIEVGVGLADLSGSMQAVILGDPRGALKLVVDREFGEILGAHMVGARAEEVIAQVVVAMEAELDYRDLTKGRQIHPSMGELLAEAAAAVE
ncbi:MAG: dihydrolipoyl dehydrogenase, partial [Acidimicrobiia bacterium]|nr:dihydrolipoyl dehydrogenase [Acidimicrobiia bacterium]